MAGKGRPYDTAIGEPRRCHLGNRHASTYWQEEEKVERSRLGVRTECATVALQETPFRKLLDKSHQSRHSANMRI
jgi:hypothetical protein